MKLKIFMFIALFSSVAAFAQTKDETALKILITKMTEAQQNYQPDGLDKIFTPDYIEISPVGEFDSREKVLGFYKPEMKPPADRMTATPEVDEFSIRNYGKFAIVIARFNYKIISDGKQMQPRSIRATIVCRKENGSWKIASAQYTGIRPPQNTPKTD